MKVFTNILLTIMLLIGWSGCQAEGPQLLKQIYIAPDLGTYLYAISMWDADMVFPVFMDKDDRYTKKFAEAYADGGSIEYVEVPKYKVGRINEALAYKTLYAAWGPETLDDLKKTKIGREDIKKRLSELNYTPEGIVITNVKDAEFAGGIALAAAHMQVLDFMKAPMRMHDEFDLIKNKGIYKTEKEKIRLQILDMLGEWGYQYKSLGRGIDYITLAIDITHYYTSHEAGLSLDDAINRLVPDGVERKFELGGRTIKYYDCYAYTGRLLEVVEYAALYQAMCPLFLEVTRAAYFDYYKPEWNLACKTGAWIMNTLCYTEIYDKSLKDIWELYSRVIGDKNTFNYIHVNSANSNPDEWMGGKMEYIVDSVPAVVYFSHSNAGRNPKRIDSVAGKWLYQGAFIWRGAIMEPFATSFSSAETVAFALKQGKTCGEAFQRKKTLPPDPRFTKPWRLIYIGDPMYKPGFAQWKSENPANRSYRQALAYLFNGDFTKATTILEQLLEQVGGALEDEVWLTLLDTYRLNIVLQLNGVADDPSKLGPLFVPHWYTEAMSYSPWVDNATKTKQSLKKGEASLLAYYRQQFEKKSVGKKLSKKLRDHIQSIEKISQ